MPIKDSKPVCEIHELWRHGRRHVFVSLTYNSNFARRVSVWRFNYSTQLDERDMNLTAIWDRRELVLELEAVTELHQGNYASVMAYDANAKQFRAPSGVLVNEGPVYCFCGLAILLTLCL